MGLPAAGGLASNNDSIIGEANFPLFGYTDLDLGNVAATALPPGDLVINWFTGLGTPQQQQPVTYFFNPNGSPNVQPSAHLKIPGLIDVEVDPLSLTLDASNSTDDGANVPLTFKWDLNDDGIFEISTGTTATLEISDVVTTFGENGSHHVEVQVFDGEFSNSFARYVHIVGIIPEPTTLTLATLNLLALVGLPRPRRRVGYRTT